MKLALLAAAALAFGAAPALAADCIYESSAFGMPMTASYDGHGWQIDTWEGPKPGEGDTVQTAECLPSSKPADGVWTCDNGWSGSFARGGSTQSARDGGIMVMMNTVFYRVCK